MQNDFSCQTAVKLLCRLTAHNMELSEVSGGEK